jgi:hypothetical protein
MIVGGCTFTGVRTVAVSPFLAAYRRCQLDISIVFLHFLVSVDTLLCVPHIIYWTLTIVDSELDSTFCPLRNSLRQRLLYNLKRRQNTKCNSNYRIAAPLFHSTGYDESVHGCAMNWGGELIKTSAVDIVTRKCEDVRRKIWRR